jgi:hypothetical protein
METRAKEKSELIPSMKQFREQAIEGVKGKSKRRERNERSMKWVDQGRLSLAVGEPEIATKRLVMMAGVQGKNGLELRISCDAPHHNAEEEGEGEEEQELKTRSPVNLIGLRGWLSVDKSIPLPLTRPSKRE